MTTVRRMYAVLPSLPEVGAVCGKAARSDLGGGREVTRVPTAKATRFYHPCGCWQPEHAT